MAYSTKLIDATKTNKYRDAEKSVKDLFRLNGFEVIPAQTLCTKKGGYYTSSGLRSELRNCIGNSKTPYSDDLNYVADQVMGADFFIDCGSYIAIVDVTTNLSPANLKTKQSKLNIRLKSYITKTGISMKVFSKATNKWIIKPILVGVVVGFKSPQYFSIDRIINALDNIDTSKGRALYSR